MTNILLEVMYVLCGLVCLAAAYLSFVDKTLKTRYGTAAFWVLLAFTFIAGPHVPSAVIGGAVVLMGVLTALKQVNIGSLANAADAFREEQSLKLGNKLFIPALTIAVVAFVVGQFTSLGGLVGLGRRGRRHGQGHQGRDGQNGQEGYEAVTARHGYLPG
jgi:uncharacterized membrane protein